MSTLLDRLEQRGLDGLLQYDREQSLDAMLDSINRTDDVIGLLKYDRDLALDTLAALLIAIDSWQSPEPDDVPPPVVQTARIILRTLRRERKEGTRID